jgi:amino acid adenylation domain-containing protein
MSTDMKIIEWNKTDRVYPLDKCLHWFIEEQVERTSDSPALTFEGKTLSYSELNTRANRLAHFLQSKGVGPETLVGICAFRSMEMVIALLAIIKAGGAYVPFDPTYPVKRLAFMIEDSRVPIILTQKACGAILENASAEVIYFEDIASDLQDYPTGNPPITTRPENLAYVIYTSGSTGNPKGAMNTHKGIVNRLLWMQETFQIGASDTLVQKTPFSFDVSVWEFFWPFMCGSRLVVAKPEGHKDAEYLQDLIQKEKITIIHFVPSMLRLFLDKADQIHCASLRHVVLSGEAVTIDLQKRYFTILKTPLHNLYGPTEAAVDVSYWKCDPQTQSNVVPIGRPISNTKLYILNEEGQSVPIGESGELHIGGVQVARGYLNRPELTAEKFIKDPFSDDPSGRLYKTGDLCRFLPDGNIEYLGRIDFQVKIRGNRIELGEIEAAILRDPSVKDSAVMVREDTPGEKRLVAYLIENEGRFSLTAMRERLAAELPDYMIPAVFVLMPAFPLSPSGKTDRLALPKPGRKRPELLNRYIAPRTETERKLVHVWCDILQLDSLGIEDNFFALGGDSLMGLKMCTRLQSKYEIKLPVVKLFQYPSILQLANFLDNVQGDDNFIDEVNERATRQRIGRFQNDPMQDGVAIIGMAGRFPGAPDINQLWDNLCRGVESITRFSKNELGPGIDQALIDNPDYVPARGIVEGADLFDAAFFGIGPLEARLMDPQHRIFLELCWTAMENAGYDSQSFAGMIGVYAGVGDNHYYPNNVLAHPDLVNIVGNAIVGYGNEKDYISTRVSYCLNLTGPGVSANTGCSTTLLAADNAFNALINYECDMALAGGVDIYVPQKSGFLFQEGGVFCRDGHCKPFDDSATGTMFCDGAGVVVLKRLADAIADGDRIYAIIRGSAKNNDGANKVSFLAPSVEGQAKVIAMAQALANVEPEDISYIEAHGTGTPLGDPIEIEALTKVFRYKTDKKQFCLLGSIKGNIGHPTIASGVAGLIKAALCLYHEKIPALLHFQKPNSRIDFQNSPFLVVDKLTPWPRSDRRRIAGISSFGFGGTNVHSIIEEAPPVQSSSVSRPEQLLILSARTAMALEKMTDNLRNHLLQNPAENLADVSFTLQRGRRYQAHRRYLVCKDIPDTVDMLVKPDPMRSQTRLCETRDPRLVFMFPGQGTQYVNMGKSFYDHEPLFRSTLDQCCEILQPHLECDLRDFLFPEEQDYEKAKQSLQNTFYTQPALFTIEYSLARLLLHWGIRPSAMLGHSVGEFVCACLAGVFSLEDALRLIATRGRLIRDLPSGSMLSVRCSAEDIEARLPENIQLAAANSPLLCVVSGPHESIAHFEAELKRDKIACKKLYTSHAFHSAMMDPVVDKFIAEVARAELKPPQMQFVSTVTTQWMTDKDATDPAYWGRHLRMPVRFSHGIRTLLKENAGIFIEVGPRSTGTTLARQHGDAQNKVLATPTMAESYSGNAEWTALLSALGYLWANGVTPDWQKFYENEKRHRIPLPAYPFERKKYWVDYVPRNGSLQISRPSKAEGESAVQDKVLMPVQTDIMGEEKLAGKLISIFEETSGLSLAGIDPSTTFLEMGMDSLLLSQVAVRIQNDFNVKIIFSQLMRDISTIKLLSDYLLTNRKESDELTGLSTKESSKTCAEQVTGPVTVPVTIPQKGLWLSSKLNDSLSCAYNESITLHLTGEVDLDVLERAVHALVEKHDAMRATFAADGSTMTISDKVIYEHQRIELDKVSEGQAREQFDAIQRRDASTPFNLKNGSLFRCYIVIMPRKQYYIVLTSHHIVCDGWSLDVLISDLCIFYNKLKEGQVLSFQAAHRYADYCSQAVKRKDTNEYKAASKYWHEKFNPSFPVLRLPADKPGNKIGVYDARRIDLAINGEIIGPLRELCKRKGYSMFTLYVTAYNLLLHKISGQRNFVVGLPIAEQNLLGQDDLVGQCVNLLPFSSPINDSFTYENYIEAVQHDLLGGYDNQIYTYIDLLNEGGVSYDHTGSAPMPAGLTNVKRYEAEDLRIDNLEVDYFANPRAFESFELYLNVIESKTSIELKCHFKTALFNKKTIEEWLKDYERILTQFVYAPDAKIGITSAVKPASIKQPSKPQASEMQVSSLNEITESLLQVWKEVLGKASINLDDNFFDLGGNSLLAAKLFAEIEKILGKTMPLSALYEAPTLIKLAEYVASGKYEQTWKSLVPINSKGTRPPLYLVHGAEGNVLLYRDLARHLGDDQPVYGLQSVGLDNKTEIDARFEAVASNYIKEIKAFQPEGPYFLGGYCLGGTIALEMAQQLKHQGERIGILFMIENFNIKTIKWPLPLSLNMANKFLNIWYHTGNLFTGSNNAKMDFFTIKARTEFNRYKISLQVSMSKLLKKIGLKNSLNFPHVKVDEAYDEALEHYVPLPYDGPIVLFGAKKRFAGLTDRLYGWGDIPKQVVELCELPMNPRGSLSEPFVKILASKLKEMLNTAISKS